MNRSILFPFGLIVLVGVGILAAFWYSEQHLPDNAGIALDNYLRYSYPAKVAIVQQAHVTMPAKFDSALSGASFGASMFFRTTFDYRTRTVAIFPVCQRLRWSTRQPSL